MPYFPNKASVPDFSTNPGAVLSALEKNRKASQNVPGEQFTGGGAGGSFDSIGGAGGSFDTPNFVVGKPNTNFATGGPISQAVTQPGSAPTGPTIYAPAPPPMSAPAGFSGYPSSDPYHVGPNPVGGSVTSSTGGQLSAGLGGKSAGGDYLQSILASLTSAYDKANAANEARFSEAKKTLSGFGKSYANEIAQNTQQQLGQAEQQAVSRGLGNSTVRSGLISQALRRQNDANLSLQDRLANARVSLLQSKYDNAPDPYQAAALLAQATQGATGTNNTLASIAAALGLSR